MIALLSTQVLTSCSRTTLALVATVRRDLCDSFSSLTQSQTVQPTGMSIGSISSGKTVSGVTFAGNTVSDSMYGIRIKAKKDATSGGVSDVTYSQSVSFSE